VKSLWQCHFNTEVTVRKVGIRRAQNCHALYRTKKAESQSKHDPAQITGLGRDAAPVVGVLVISLLPDA